ncbi:MAG TPA: class I SAM-dependent methyltransferase [Methylomirabilota bacterium]|jgi:SAM-dependent methyltransferase|nr:class I SAM-dependent methyltransferase [Methylomirabilota bacterium]
MARLPAYARYRDCPIPREDPLRFHYWPLVGRLYRKRIDGCLALLGRGHRVLDVGYGSGTSFLGLAERFDEVHGLDMHEYADAITRVFAAEGVRVRLARGSVLTPPYEPATFDAILAMSVLEHLQPADQPGVMRELARLLRPGGVLVAGVPGLNTLMTAGFWALGCDIKAHHFSSPEVVIAAASAVLQVERVARNPAVVPDALVTYVWFRARKVLPSAR